MNRIKWIFLSLCNAKKPLKKKSSMKKVVIRIVVLLVAFYLCKSLHYQFPMRTVPRDIDLWIWWQNWNSCNIVSLLLLPDYYSTVVGENCGIVLPDWPVKSPCSIQSCRDNEWRQFAAYNTLLLAEYTTPGCYPYGVWCENKINFCLLRDNIESKLESVKHKAGPQ